MSAQQKASITGAIYNTAFGDAWGNLTEFHSYSRIISDKPDFPNQAKITDDTQMSIYGIQVVLDNLDLIKTYERTSISSERDKMRDQLRILFADAFTVWLHDPDNNRAPGNTCLTALHTYGRKTPVNGFEGTVFESKGCGANMRAMWLGLLPFSPATIADLAVIQAQTTHGHPLALSASALTALAVNAVFTGEVTPSKAGTLTGWAYAKTRQLTAQPTWDENYTEGLEDLEKFLWNGKESYERFMQDSNEKSDPCSYFGEGWIAEEALMNALAVTDFYSDDIVGGLHRLVYSNGDSDSIAAIGGAMLGTHLGETENIASWISHIEPRYQKELEDVHTRLTELYYGN